MRCIINVEKFHSLCAKSITRRQKGEKNWFPFRSLCSTFTPSSLLTMNAWHFDLNDIFGIFASCVQNEACEQKREAEKNRFFCCCRRLETNFQHFFSSGEGWLVMVTMESKITLLIMHNGKSQNEIKCEKKSKKRMWEKYFFENNNSMSLTT